MTNKKSLPSGTRQAFLSSMRTEFYAKGLYHMQKENTSGAVRTRSWTAIVYPDSAPENWRDILDDLHIEWAESPLHEFDVDPSGELKKPHWHIVLAFEGKKSYDQVKAMLAPLNGPIPLICHSLKGAVRYFCHLDNPDKYQYPTSSIISHGGFDVQSALAPTSSKRYTLIKDMIDFVKANHVLEFQDLMDYAAAEHFDDWFPLLCDSSAYVVGQYIKSQRARMQSTERRD